MTHALQSRAATKFTATKLLFPVLLTVAVLLGGAIRDAFIATATLEVLACFVLIWCLFDKSLRVVSGSAAWLLGMVVLGGLICLLQLAPLPYEWWTVLPGRADVAAAFTTVGIGDTTQPMSLAPDRTLSGVLRLLPPLAVFVLAAKLPWKLLSSQLPWLIVFLAVVSGMLAFAQAFAGHVPILFPYGTADRGQAPGIFEVVNHQATLQLMAIPFIMLLFGNLRSKFDQGDAFQALGIMSAAAFVVVLAAGFLSGSLAGYALAIPVVLVSLVLVIDRKPGPKTIAGLALVVALAAALAYVVLTSPTMKGLGVTDLGDGPLSRREYFRGTVEMVHDYWPAGVGLGAFEAAYPSYENAQTVTPVFASHAHNDYLEFAAELGLLGCGLMAGVIVWWGAMTVHAWRTPRELGGRLKRAASLAVGVVLVHSLVDSPARTEAICCLAAVCLGVMSTGSFVRRERATLLDPERQAFMHRHIEI